MQQNGWENEENTFNLVIMLLLGVIVCVAVTGCSMRMEFGYHGQTGRDDRIQTKLVGTEKRPAYQPY